MPEPGQKSFRSGRSETSLEEMTAGSVASVPMPMGKTIKRESGITKGIKKSVVDEAEISENDLIIMPGQMSKRPNGFMSKDRNEMERIEMAKSDVIQSVKSAKTIFSILKTSDDEIEGWVQEKLAKAEDYLNTVREYLEGKSMPAEAQSASARMQKALQREKEKREYSERYAEKHFPIGKKPEPINKEKNVSEMNVGKRKPKPDSYHINKDGKPVSLASYSDKDSAVKDRDEKHPDAEVHQVGARGKVKGKFEEGKVEKTSTGLKHHGDFPDYPKEKGKEFNHNIDRLNKSETSRLDKAFDVNWEKGKNRQVTGDPSSVKEGAKVDRMVKHVKSSEKKLGHGDKEAENIAWATANKRGMLNNKNKKVDEESEGLWANIHAKQKRIKNGSGEHMRKPGSKGAPTADALRKSAK